MKKITIKRVAFVSSGTYGVLLDDGEPFALTAERPWTNNTAQISCIPVGQYVCEKVKSPKFGDTYMVLNVPNRSSILFHKGNIPSEDSHGCILVGESFDLIGGKQGITASAKGFAEFMIRLKDCNQFELNIVAA